jgi:hypothetical protein
MMISIYDNDGNGLEIANGSDIYYRGADGKDTHMEWDTIPEADKEKLLELVERSERIMASKGSQEP